MDSIRCKIIKSEYKVQWKLHNGKFYDSLKTLLTESDKTFSDNSYIAVVFHKDSVEVAKMRYKMEFNIDYDTIELKGYLDGFSGNPYDVLIKFNNQGNIDWQETFSSLDVSNQNYDWAGEDIALTDDGGAIIAIDNGRFGFLKISNIQNILNGDLNNDNTLNVLDVVLMVNVILDDNSYLPEADLNLDGAINVLDVINLINLILN